MPTPLTSPNPATKTAQNPHRGLAEIVDVLRRHAQTAQEQSRLAREIQQLRAAAHLLEVGKPGRAKAAEAAMDLAQQRERMLHAHTRERLAQRPTHATTGAFEPDDGEWIWWALRENLPGHYPFTAGAAPCHPHSGRVPTPTPPDPDPARQWALALAQGFDTVLTRCASGLHVDAAVSELLFTLNPNADAPHAVLDRVARRLWAVALHEHWGANERSQQWPGLPHGLITEHTHPLSDLTEQWETRVLAELEAIAHKHTR
jgi:hypothetical protein